MDEKNILIICITVIICVLIVVGTVFVINFNNNDNSDNSVPIQVSNNDFEVNSVTFYSDGNPNTGESATINVGKQHSGENVNVITIYSRDGKQMNYPSEYETHTVDVDGNIMITDYTPMPKYPDYCRIEMIHNNNKYVYDCDIGKHKGTQTAIPRKI